MSVPYLYHLALRDEWNAAVDGGEPYRRSTLGLSLEDEGFIHCSFARQVQAIADAVYRGRDDVVLLVVDPTLVPAELRVENQRGGAELFPHIYGELPLEAVIWVERVPLGPDGRLEVDGLVSDD